MFSNFNYNFQRVLIFARTLNVLLLDLLLTGLFVDGSWNFTWDFDVVTIIISDFSSFWSFFCSVSCLLICSFCCPFSCSFRSPLRYLLFHWCYLLCLCLFITSGFLYSWFKKNSKNLFSESLIYFLEIFCIKFFFPTFSHHSIYFLSIK